MGIVPLCLSQIKRAFVRFFKIKYMVPVQMRKQVISISDVLSRNFRPAVIQCHQFLVSGRSHGDTLSGMLCPGHTSVNQNQLVSAFN